MTNLVSFPEFVWVWNRLQGLSTPAHHVRLARWLERLHGAKRRNGLLMAFRNSGKSTIVGLFCAWMLLRQPDLRIIVVAADHALAKKMARNVKRVIERHPLTRSLKPRRRDQWAADQFTVNRASELRDPSMMAKGLSGNITGSRADVVICDDVEVPNTCDTAPKRADLRERLSDLDFVLVPGGMHLFVGTPHTYHTIYAADPRPESGALPPFLDGFKRLELPLLDKQGRGAWPERFSLEKVHAMRKRAGPNKFRSQMMLEPVNIIDGRLDPDRLRLYDDELDYHEGNFQPVLRLGGKRLISASCWWDPAYGAPGKGDASVIACIFTDEDGQYRLHRVLYMEHQPNSETDEASQLCGQVAQFVKTNHLPAVRLETNGLGRFLPGLLRRELAQAGVRCAVIEETSRRSKDARIIDAFDAPLAAGALWAHRSVWSTPFLTEMREWRPATNGADDGLDAVSGCLLSEPVRLPRTIAAGAAPDWRPGSEGWKARTEFDV